MNTADTRDATGILDENDASIDQLQPNLTGLNTSGRSNGQGTVPLLGLETSTTPEIEITREISEPASETKRAPRRNPLLGTITSQVIENVGGSSQDGPPNSFCYDNLLRFGADSQQVKPRKSAGNGPRGCYGFSPGLLPKGMRLRGGRFYVRRHVPCDLQAPLNRVELWRSLKTDSLQTALRRMPAVMAGIEAEFDRVRAGIGATADDANSRLPTVAQPIVEKVRVAAECPASVSSNGLTLAEAYQQYVYDPTHRWSASTRQSYDTCRKLAISVIGGDVPMGSFGRTHCRDFLDVLRHL